MPSAAGSSGAPAAAASAASSGPVSLTSFLSNAQRSFAGPTASLKRQNSLSLSGGYEDENSQTGSALFNRLKKAKV